MPRQPLLGRRVSTVLRHPPVQRRLSVYVAGERTAVRHSCAALRVHIHAAAEQTDGRQRDGRQRDGTTALTTRQPKKKVQTDPCSPAHERHVQHDAPVHPAGVACTWRATAAKGAALALLKQAAEHMAACGHHVQMWAAPPACERVIIGNLNPPLDLVRFRPVRTSPMPPALHSQRQAACRRPLDRRRHVSGACTSGHRGSYSE